MLVQSGYNLVNDLDEGTIVAAQRALDSLFLTFIFVELLAAVRVTIREGTLVAEPFFLVGIIASIKELILLIGTEELSSQGWEKFRNGMIEVGVVTGVIAVLTLCTLWVRRRLARARRGRRLPRQKLCSRGGARGRPSGSTKLRCTRWAQLRWRGSTRSGPCGRTWPGGRSPARPRRCQCSSAGRGRLERGEGRVGVDEVVVVAVGAPQVLAPESEPGLTREAPRAVTEAGGVARFAIVEHGVDDRT